MQRFVLHKKGFYYTDEYYASAESLKGTIIGIFDSLEDAKIEKERQEINSLRKLSGSVGDFLSFDNDYENIFNSLKDFFKTEFNMVIEDAYEAYLPKEVNEKQLKQILEITGISFHDIIQYDEIGSLNPADFELDETEYGEF